MRDYLLLTLPVLVFEHPPDLDDPTNASAAEHVYSHSFADGKVTTTAWVSLNPPLFRVEWRGPLSRRYWPEYVTWRQTIFDDVKQRTGHRIGAIDLI